jgi:hypothetical protein
MPPDATALAMPLRQLSPLLQPFLLEHVQASAARVPPHLTIHLPFLPFDAITESVREDLARLFASVACFPVTLRHTNRFPQAGVLYLEPDDPAPLLAISSAVWGRFPAAVPDFPEPIMHLTIAHGNHDAAALDRLEDIFHRRYGNLLPFHATASEVVLYVKQDNEWQEHLVFPLAMTELA